MVKFGNINSHICIYIYTYLQHILQNKIYEQYKTSITGAILENHF